MSTIASGGANSSHSHQEKLDAALASDSEVSDIDAPGGEGEVEPQELQCAASTNAISELERELWVAARPLQLRRHAGEIWAQRFPAATVGRLTGVHPDLHTRSPQALDIINCSTVLFLRKVVESVARRRSNNSKVCFQDVRDACANMTELWFLHPSGLTLDSTAHHIQGIPLPAKPSKDDRLNGGAARAPLDSGQKTLNNASFVKASTEISSSDATPKRFPPQPCDAEQEKKRKLPPTSVVADKKAKTGKRSAKEVVIPAQGPGILGLLQRPVAPAGA